MPPEWRFRKQCPADININPIQGQFFKTDSLGSISDALVREAIQNSLDAAMPGSKVTVRFTFDTSLEIEESGKRRELLAGLWEHINAPGTGLSDVPKKSDLVSALVIEDFGTRGLQGDPMQYDDLNGREQRNDFYYFWRNVGRGKKEGTDRGRWGLGKTVFQAASRINSFFGISTTNGNRKKTFLMGQAILKIHKLGEERYTPYGYYGIFDEQDFALPVQDIKEIIRFVEIMPVDRLGKPGLSVVIPFPVEEISPGEIEQSIIRHYSIPILANDMDVEIKAKGSRPFIIDASTIENRLLGSDWKEKEKEKILGFLRLARWGLQKSVPDLEVQPPPLNSAPRLSNDLFDPSRLEACRERFSVGEKLAIKFSISVKKRGQAPALSNFMMYLEKDHNIEYAQDCFVRNGITIPEVSSLKFKGVRAIVIIQDRELSTLLGDAENPAHTDWERSSERLKQYYEHGPTTLGYVKTSPRELVSLFTQPLQGRDEILLNKLFPKMQEEGEGKDRDIRKDSVPELQPPSLRIEKIGTGFRVTSTDGENLINKWVLIQTAYEVARGNPIGKYSPFDFVLDSPQFSKEAIGLSIKNVNENKIYFLVEKKDFSLKITGFDENRDLRVKVIVDEKGTE